MVKAKKKYDVLFLGRSVYHFSYYESILSSLIDEYDVNLKILFDKQWSQNQPQESLNTFDNKYNKFLKNNISIGWFERRKDIFRNFVFVLRELTTFSSYLSRKDQSYFYSRRWRSYLPNIWREITRYNFVRKIIGSKLVFFLLKQIENFIPTSKNIDNFLKNLSPDIIIVSPANMRFSEQTDYLKSAKKLSIKTVVPVLSWDNLSTKGLFHIKPDLLIAWNKTHELDALKIHNIPKEKILISGSPFFDKWLNTELKEDAKDFKSQLGIDEDEDYILYLGSSSNIAKDETWIIQEISQKLKTCQSPINKLKIVARPHPANFKNYKKVEGKDIIIWPKEFSLPESLSSQKTFYNSVLHSICCIGLNTSGMIDATIMDKACIAYITEEYNATQTNAQHFNYLLKSNIFPLAKNTPEVIQEIGNLIKNNDKYKDARKRFIKEFVRPSSNFKKAGEVAANQIINFLNES